MANLFNLDYLQHLSKKYGLSPGKKYGQNFLIDEEVIGHIIECAQLSKGDTVVEVGPGFGVLTLPLVEQAGKVISFEIERKLELYWSEMIKNRNILNLEIVWGNILRSFTPTTYQLPPNSYKVVANLPYQVTSAVIRLFLEAEHPPSEMVLMVQKEVGERICAKPGQMSLLSVSVYYYADTEYLFTVPRASFWPAPAVDSCVIKIMNNKQLTPLGAQARNKPLDDRFFSLVKAGFANRRKLLFKNLLPIIGKEHRAALEQAFQALGLLPTVRAQELSVAQWQELAKIVISIRSERSLS